MNVVVTGSRGFVGRHLVTLLRGAGHDVVGIDLTGEDHADDVRMDLLDRDAVRDLFVGLRPERVFHLAGLTFEPVDSAGDLRLDQANVMAVSSVVDACAAVYRKFERRPRLIFASSCSVYGVPSAADGRVTTKDPPRPVLKYGWSKLTGEELAICAARRGQIEAVCARSFNIVGPGERANSVVGTVVAQLEAGSSTISLGDITTVRDFVDVRDVVRAFEVLADRGRNMGIYNVGSGHGTVVGDLVRAVIDASGGRADIRFDPARVSHANVPAIYADISDLIALGWKPQYSIQQTVADILASSSRRSGESS